METGSSSEPVFLFFILVPAFECAKHFLQSGKLLRRIYYRSYFFFVP